MATLPTVRVRPIYGWGWTIAGKPRFQAPEPFTLELEEKGPGHWAGKVLEERHEFRSQRVVLSQRHVEWTGHVNILVDASDPASEPSFGFGRLEERP